MRLRLVCVAIGVLLCVPVVPAAMARGPMDDVRRHVEEASRTFDEADPGAAGASTMSRSTASA